MGENLCLLIQLKCPHLRAGGNRSRESRLYLRSPSMFVSGLASKLSLQSPALSVDSVGIKPHSRAGVPLASPSAPSSRAACRV